MAPSDRTWSKRELRIYSLARGVGLLVPRCIRLPSSHEDVIIQVKNTSSDLFLNLPCADSVKLSVGSMVTKAELT